MGYYVSLEEADFKIPETEEVLNVLKDLNRLDHLKTGGQYSGGVTLKRWFAWMPENYDQTVKSVAEVFNLLGFETDTESYDGEYVGLTYYDSKTGSEDIFIDAVAPFVANGSYLSWRGEEGERWRQTVEHGKISTQYATTVWSE
jgi:hypothetical protein